MSGWVAILWVIRLLAEDDVPVGRHPAWRAFCALLGRIVSGDFRLRGCWVREWTLCVPGKRIEVAEINIEGNSCGFGDPNGFTLIVRSVFLDKAEALAWVNDRVHVEHVPAVALHYFTKRVLTLP